MLLAKEIQQELKQLYRKWPEIKRFLKPMGCDELLAEDIFQEALLIYARKREQVDFTLTVEPFYYVRNTCKLLYYNHARKLENKQTVRMEMDGAEPEEDWFEKELKMRSIENAIGKLGEQCKEILSLFYNLGWSMVAIAEKVGLRNEKVAKVQKYRCIQKAKELIQELPEMEINLESYGK